MADEYISIEMQVEETGLADDAVSRLQDRWPTWEPNDGDLEVVQIEAIASMAGSLADTTVSVPSTILQTLGLELYGVEPGQGAPAIGLLNIDFIDGAGNYFVPAGSAFEIDSYIFETVDDITTAVNQTTATSVRIQATEDGVEYNDIGGPDATPISALTSIVSATLQGPTTGGADPDTDDDYMARLLRELRLSSRTLTVLRDYEEFALSYTDVGRALALNNGPRAVAVFLLGPDGLIVSAARKSELLAEYDDAREVNSTVTIFDPAFGYINVDYAVAPYPGFAAADLVSRCNAKLGEMLDPIYWGRPKYIGDLESALWVNDPVVRRNKLIDGLGDVEGVDYVNSLVINGTNSATNAVLSVSGVTQEHTLATSAALTGGTYKINLDGEDTGQALSYLATGPQIQAAIENLVNTNPGDVKVTGSAFPYKVEHTGAFFGRTRVLTITNSTLTGGTINVTQTRAPVAGTGDVQLPLANGMVGLALPGTFNGRTVVP